MPENPDKTVAPAGKTSNIPPYRIALLISAIGALVGVIVSFFSLFPTGHPSGLFSKDLEFLKQEANENKRLALQLKTMDEQTHALDKRMAQLADLMTRTPASKLGGRFLEMKPQDKQRLDNAYAELNKLNVRMAAIESQESPSTPKGRSKLRT